MRSDAKELRLSEGGGEQIEKRILDLVSASGEAGILQRDVWHLLKLDSRKGSRIVKRLEQMGLVTREVIVHRGRRMYLLKPTLKLLRSPKLSPLLGEIPCFYCPLLLNCFNNERHPLICEKLDRWLRGEA